MYWATFYLVIVDLIIYLVTDIELRPLTTHQVQAINPIRLISLNYSTIAYSTIAYSIS